MYWECICEEKYFENGNREGFSNAMKHLWEGRKGEIEGEHRITGLYKDDGELLVAGQNIRKAIKEGYIEPAEKPKEDQESKVLKSVIKAKSKFLEIEIDPEILVLFYLTKSKFPEYAASIGDWISDCLVDYYNEHRELGLDALLANRPEIFENYILKGVD